MAEEKDAGYEENSTNSPLVSYVDVHGAKPNGTTYGTSVYPYKPPLSYIPKPITPINSPAIT